MSLTQILQRGEAADSTMRGELIAAAYDDLRRLAARRMQGERANHTLTATALANEVSMKLLAERRLPLGNPGQFFAYAARAMRHQLIDHARTRLRRKRGGDRARLPLDDDLIAVPQQNDDLLALDAALDALSQVDPRRARLVELRFFGGLSNQEIAAALEISPATVKRDWAVAKARLRHFLDQQAGAIRPEGGDSPDGPC